MWGEPDVAALAALSGPRVEAGLARARGKSDPTTYDGSGTCYLEFGAERIARWFGRDWTPLVGDATLAG